MATEGPNQAAAVAEFDDGWVPWVNVANAITFDQSYATALLVQTFTNFLDYTGFNFATVGDATGVTNVRVEVACKSSTLSGSPVLASVQLIIGGVVVGDAKTVSVPLLTSESWVDCGNASVAADFSTTLNGAQAKASGFGARVQFYDDDTATISADACRITLTFTGSVGPPLGTCGMMGAGR